VILRECAKCDHTFEGVLCTWGKDLSGSMQGAGGVGDLLLVNRIGYDVHPFYDGNGNACQYYGQTQNSGSEAVYAGRWEYNAFGKTVKKSEDVWSDALLHRFSTKMQDIHGAGLYYYGYRYYNPETGKWPSRAPIEEQGGIGLYGFVNNSLITSIDEVVPENGATSVRA